jgi:MFS family permease
MLGISSAVNNLTLVVATAAVGWLAEIRWHFAFAVYLLPAITLILIPALRSSTPMPEPPEGAQHRQQRLNGGMIVGLMLFYFVITYTSLVVTYNTSALVAKGGMDASTSGVIISLFFLAIMAPGLLLNRLIAVFGNKINLVSLIVMGVGLMLIALMRPTALWLIVGVVMTGLGYGVMQPIIYDKAATNAPPHLATLALSITMAVNYLAILVAPFIIDLTNQMLHSTSHSTPFATNGVLTLLLALLTLLTYRRSRVLGSDD